MSCDQVVHGGGASSGALPWGLRRSSDPESELSRSHGDLFPCLLARVLAVRGLLCPLMWMDLRPQPLHLQKQPSQPRMFFEKSHSGGKYRGHDTAFPVPARFHLPVCFSLVFCCCFCCGGGWCRLPESRYMRCLRPTRSWIFFSRPIWKSFSRWNNPHCICGVIDTLDCFSETPTASQDVFTRFLCVCGRFSFSFEIYLFRYLGQSVLLF